MTRAAACLVGALLGLIGGPGVHGEEKVKVSGTEIQSWLSRYWALAGTNDSNGCVFLVISHSADKREQYFNCPTGAGTGTGTARVDGDRLCSKWSYSNMTESCSDIYRIGENRYETGGAVKFYNLK